jgi:hypothetical protein
MKEQDERGIVETTGNALSLLATRGQEALYEKNGATRQSRTGDLLITNCSEPHNKKDSQEKDA